MIQLKGSNEYKEEIQSFKYSWKNIQLKNIFSKLESFSETQDNGDNEVDWKNNMENKDMENTKENTEKNE